MNLGEKRVKKFFKSYGFNVLRLQPLIRGLPDFLVWRPKINEYSAVGALFVEVKSTEQKYRYRDRPFPSMFSVEQKNFLLANNFICIVVFVDTKKSYKDSITFFKVCVLKKKIHFIKFDKDILFWN